MRIYKLRAAVALFAFGLLAMVFFPPPAKAAPAPIGLRSTARITKLIYPTFGNPAIKQKGDTFTIELDPREGARWGAGIPDCTDIAVTVTSANDPHPVTRSLQVLSSELGYSTQWPGQSEYIQKKTPDNRIYLITVKVPYSVPADLYDLTIKFRLDGALTTDTQIHSFNAIDAYKENFTFVQLSDIHVFGPECAYPSSNQKKRNQRHTDYRETGSDGYGDGYGAQYLRESIVQLNKMKPDFVINTGDNMFGQYYFSQTDAQRKYGSFGEMTEYEFEQLWFYQEMTKLDVPIFMVLGNHDSYNESTATSPPARTNDDWQYSFKKIWGPLYRSFDYGDAHFAFINSIDWEKNLRTLNQFGPINVPFYGEVKIMQPTKYKGQIGSRGDAWQKGHSDERFAGESPGVYIGQLQWLKEDLQARSSSKIRVIAMHHDPLKNADPATSGSMWSSEEGGEGGFLDLVMDWFGAYMDMGDGEGRIASMRLMRDYRVGLCISGHDHSDWYGTLPWTDGGGQIKFVNTTSTSFQSNKDSDVYPGYQKFNVNGGQVSFGYLDNLSYPFYQGTNVGGSTNLGGLRNPAIQHSWTYAPNQANPTSASCRLTNTLARKNLPDAYMEFPMTYLNNKHYYQVENGAFAELYDNAGSDHRICQVYSTVGADSSTVVTVKESTDADSVAPVGTVKINNGAPETSTRDVTLNLRLSDVPSGLKDMMISNRSDFAGAEWESYRTSRPWALAPGNGARKVYVKARDRAMPPNEKTFSATILLNAPDPTVWYLAEGTTDWGFDTYVNIQNPNEERITAEVTYMTAGGEIKRPDLTLPPMSQTVINPRDDLPSPMDFSTRVRSGKPISVDRRMLWTGPGAASSGGHGSVGVNAPAMTWYLPEGSSKWGFETWLLIQNPSDTDATCDVTYMVEGGDPVTIPHQVKARSRNTFNMADDIGARDASIKVESNVPVIPERAMYRNNRREGHNSIGTTTPARDYYLAEGTTDWGFTTYLLVQNPNPTPARVDVVYMTPGGPARKPAFDIPANSRKTINVNEEIERKDLSIHVIGDVPIVAERAMYWDNGAGEACHDSIGMATPAKTFYLPDGETYGGVETWTLVQNPGGSPANVEISYLTSTGTENVTFTDVVPANSRRTYNMSDRLPNHRASVLVKSQSDIMVERAMYWNNRGAGTGTIGGK